ncbi:hypothetical protein K488DRAFT_72448 [Vararia minispora EC-137]|uniref:Uncharacterized protein n=1 Tax=Vararia minispora EC-137 TaxID=1314806 RepID=A0ACB8QEM3_9AGAM|nr:hypothetical protein K488DRAFT_72448 [Vararia minispora EC-137]
MVNAQYGKFPQTLLPSFTVLASTSLGYLAALVFFSMLHPLIARKTLGIQDQQVQERIRVSSAKFSAWTLDEAYGIWTYAAGNTMEDKIQPCYDGLLTSSAIPLYCDRDDKLKDTRPRAIRVRLHPQKSRTSSASSATRAQLFFHLRSIDSAKSYAVELKQCGIENGTMDEDRIIFRGRRRHRPPLILEAQSSLGAGEPSDSPSAIPRSLHAGSDRQHSALHEDPHTASNYTTHHSAVNDAHTRSVSHVSDGLPPIVVLVKSSPPPASSVPEASSAIFGEDVNQRKLAPVPELTVEAFLRRSVHLGPTYAARKRRRRSVNPNNGSPSAVRAPPSRHTISPLFYGENRPQGTVQKRKRYRLAGPKKSIAQRLLEAAATTGVDMPLSGPCAPPDGRRPLIFRSFANWPPPPRPEQGGQLLGAWNSGVRCAGAIVPTAAKRRGVRRAVAETYKPLAFIPLADHEAAWRTRGSRVD